MMQSLEYQVRFNTPAFLGNARQSGQWRTPPFKASLRQWWRIAYAAANNYRVDRSAMRETEGQLFGHVGDGGGDGNRALKSRVRLRLDRWTEGTLHSWSGLEQKPVQLAAGPGRNMSPHAYLGYGPLDGRGGTKLTKPPALNAGEVALLRMAVPDSDAGLIQQTLNLMNAYAAVGGRSRNGWGSFELVPANGSSPLAPMVPSRPWRDALAEEWPHAIGADASGPLIWETDPQTDWKALMRVLAQVKLGLRSEFRFQTGSAGDSRPQERHWLAYPVTKHPVRAWDREKARLPNSLRFKARRDGTRCVGVIFHVPCLPPSSFEPDLDVISAVWERAHRYLDAHGLRRTEA